MHSRSWGVLHARCSDAAALLNRVGVLQGHFLFALPPEPADLCVCVYYVHASQGLGANKYKPSLVSRFIVTLYSRTARRGGEERRKGGGRNLALVVEHKPPLNGAVLSQADGLSERGRGAFKE